MNRSNNGACLTWRARLERCSRALVILIPLIWAVWWIVWAYPGIWTPDTLRQFGEAMDGVYNNWKPTLYALMLGFFEKCFPGNGIGMAYVVQIVCMGLSVMLIAVYYTKRHVCYSLLVLVLPLFFTQKCVLVTTVGNDELAAACYLMYIACILWGGTIRCRGWRYLLLIFAWLILGYGMVLRHNSMPCVALLAAWGSWKCGVNKVIHMAFSGLLFVVLAASINAIIISAILRVESTYPLRFPLAADIVNLSILDGKWHPVPVGNFSLDLTPPHESCMLAPDCVNRGGPLDPYAMYDGEEKRLRDYNALKSTWLKMVLAHPVRYVQLKLFFFHQFLLEGRCIPWLCEQLRESYPHISIHMERESRNWRAWVNREFLSMSVVPLICYAFLLLCFWKPLRRWVAECPVRVDAVVFIGVAFLYTSTFILLVLSATEQRFYIIRAVLCCVSAAILALSVLEREKP